jgi:hypothetical protein
LRNVVSRTCAMLSAELALLNSFSNNHCSCNHLS